MADHLTFGSYFGFNRAGNAPGFAGCLALRKDVKAPRRLAGVVVGFGLAMFSATIGIAQSDSGFAPTAQGSVSGSGHYQVERGDSLFGIARRFGLTIDALKAMNSLDGDRISVGQRLTVQVASTAVNEAMSNQAPDLSDDSRPQAEQAHTYVVQSGDTAFRIAKTAGISLETLASLNDLDAEWRLSVGQVLSLASPSVNQPVTGATSMPPTPSPQPIASHQATGNATPGALVAGPDVVSWPSLPPSNTEIAQAETAVLESEADWSKNVPLSRADTATTTTVRLSRRRVDDEGELTSNSEALHLPSVGGGGEENRRFAWPVRGRLLSGFGPRENGLVNDGINIAVRSGEIVKAAATGQVIYASDEMHAFGKLILLQHADGWVTAYAHNDRLHVQVGDYVELGQKIASAGSSGTVDRSQLHFEVRHNGQPVNPMNVLVF